MDTKLDSQRAWRVVSQKVGAERCQGAAEVVKWLCGVQAQDYRWARWSIGLRTTDCDERDVERSIAEHEIVRTWMFRGTLHFVAAEDLPWLTALLAPGIIRGNARRYRQLGLDDEVFTVSQGTIRRALEERGALTRAEIVTFLQQDGVPAEGQQVPYLLQRAALDGVIWHGSQRGAEPEYVLAPGNVRTGPALDRHDALGRLVARYLAGHGPATRHDLAWWAGLGMAEAQTALDAAPKVASREVGGVAYLTVGDPPTAPATSSACLLPRFDEYLLGYKERSLVLDPGYTKVVNAGGGMPKPTVMVDGRIVGIWSYVVKKQEIIVSVEPFHRPTAHEHDAIERAADQLAHYASLPVTLRFAPAAPPHSSSAA